MKAVHSTACHLIGYLYDYFSGFNAYNSTSANIAGKLFSTFTVNCAKTFLMRTTGRQGEGAEKQQIWGCGLHSSIGGITPSLPDKGSWLCGRSVKFYSQICTDEWASCAVSYIPKQTLQELNLHPLHIWVTGLALTLLLMHLNMCKHYKEQKERVTVYCTGCLEVLAM